MRKPGYLLLTMVLTFILLLSACAKATPTATPTPSGTTTPTVRPTPTPTATNATTPQYGGTMRLAFHIPPRSFFPANLAVPITGWYIYDSLLMTDLKSEKLYPSLATDWKVVSTAPVSITLTMRKGVKFHDGTDFNAAAVKWNIETRQAAKLADYQEITSIDVVDDSTVRLNLSSFKNTSLVPLWNQGGLMYSPTAYQKNGREQSLFNPVGTGPFKFVSYDVNQLLKATRFDGYWQQGRPYLDEYNTYFIADATTRSLSFLNGELDEIIGTTPADLQNVIKAGYKPQGIPNVVQEFIPDSANADSPLANQKVREAVDYAVDKAGMVKALGYGFWLPTGQLTKFSYANVPNLTERTYDPAKAKQLLKDAGYADGFKTTLYYQSTASSDVLVAFSTNLQAVGIQATLTPVDITRFSQLQTGGWKGLIFDVFRESPDFLQSLANVMSTGVTYNVSLQRPSGWQDLLDKALATGDSVAKATMAQQLNKLAFDNAMTIPLYQSGSIVIMGNNVHPSTTGLQNGSAGGGAVVWDAPNFWLSKK